MFIRLLKLTWLIGTWPFTFLAGFVASFKKPRVNDAMGQINDAPDATVSDEKKPIALIYPDNHPTAVLVISKSQDTEVDVDQRAAMGAQRAGVMLSHLIYRFLGEDIPVRYALERKVSRGHHSFYVSLFSYFPDDTRKLDHIVIAVDSKGETEFYELMSRNNRLNTVDTGSGALEEEWARYIQSFLNEVRGRSTRVYSRRALFPKKLCGWVIRDDKREGAIDEWVKDFFKPVLSVVPKSD